MGCNCKQTEEKERRRRMADLVDQAVSTHLTPEQRASVRASRAALGRAINAHRAKGKATGGTTEGRAR